MIGANLEDRLQEAKLRYVTTDIPGIRRVRHGKGFSYINPKGKPITDARTREWIKSIVIPPAWQDVWISPYKNAHLLAFGRDAQGRKQYRYHPNWNALSQETLFSQIEQFGKVLPIIRETVDHDLRRKAIPREKVLALVVTLLENTLIRVGNDEYTRHNSTYGLTTLEDDHVTIHGETVHFEFVGKSSKSHTLNFRNQRLARAVKACQELPGQRLFAYKDEAGNVHAVGSADVNDYLRQISGEGFTAKMFRTWGASALAVEVLAALPFEPTKKGREKQIRDCVCEISEALNNTKAVCRKYYVHPAVLQAHRDGNLAELYASKRASRSPYGLSRAEATLVALTKQQ